MLFAVSRALLAEGCRLVGAHLRQPRNLDRVGQLLASCEAPVLLGFNAADRGREMESLSDEKVVASAMQTLKIIYGNDIPEPIDFQITRWAADPFAFGSYSFNALGRRPVCVKRWQNRWKVKSSFPAKRRMRLTLERLMERT